MFQEFQAFRKIIEKGLSTGQHLLKQLKHLQHLELSLSLKNQ